MSARHPAEMTRLTLWSFSWGWTGCLRSMGIIAPMVLNIVAPDFQTSSQNLLALNFLLRASVAPDTSTCVVVTKRALPWKSASGV